MNYKQSYTAASCQHFMKQKKYFFFENKLSLLVQVQVNFYRQKKIIKLAQRFEDASYCSEVSYIKAVDLEVREYIKSKYISN